MSLTPLASASEATRLATGPLTGSEALYLLVVSGPQQGKYFRVPRSGGQMGRSKLCAVRIDDPSLSEDNIELKRLKSGHFQIEDQASRYGIYIDRKAVNNRILADGDLLELSSETHLRCRYLAPHMVPETIRESRSKLLQRNYLIYRLEEDLAFTRRQNLPLSLLHLDLDHFSEFNQQHGHQVGQQLILRIAQRLNKAARTEDLLALYGSDEFLVMVRGFTEEACEPFAQRLRKEAQLAVKNGPEHLPELSASVGIAECQSQEVLTPLQLLARAETALYNAKRLGRDQVVLFTSL